MLKLLENKTANDTGEWVPSMGYQGMLTIEGLTGGSVSIEIKGPETGVALPIVDINEGAIGVFTSSLALAQLPIPLGVSVRASLTSATGNVYVTLS